MKTLAYIPIHYGLEYLEYTIKSIKDNVSKIVCLYTEKPSYGYRIDQLCPENEGQLQELAQDTSRKVEWVHIPDTSREGTHRDMAFRYSNGYDVMITLDTDEVWEPDVLAKSIEQASKTDSRFIAVDGFVNFWRSFDYVVIDWFHPIRMHNLKSHNREVKHLKSTIYHFGYAQSEEIMRYKFAVHGHKSEFLPSYLDKKYYSWDHIGCGVEWLHPASTTIWQDAEKYDKTKLPELLKAHPNYDKKII